MKPGDTAEPVAGKLSMAKQVAQGADGAVFASIGKALARGARASILGLGRLHGKDGSPPSGRNQLADERTAIGSSAGVSFYAGKLLKRSLN